MLLKQQEEEAARRRVEAKKAEAEARLRESERQEAEREARRKAQARRHLHRKRAGIALVVLLTLAMCIAGYICFFAVPEARYESAVRLVEQADYGEAKEVFERLGDYKDSRYRAQECAALDALLQDDVDDVVALINGQIEAGEEESVERVRNVVQDVVRDWRAQGLSPFAVLRCLQASEVLDPMSELDVQALFQSAHVELAGGDSLLQWRVGDVDGDGEDELIALDAEMAVRVYHMAALENQEIATDVALKADLLLSFGDAVANEDGKQALSCYRRALELQDTPETREKVAAICSVLASTSAKEGDFDDALASAQTAVDMVDTKDMFAQLYSIARQAAQRQADFQAATKFWDAFCAEQEERLNRYGMRAQAEEQAGALRLAHANSLAAQQDAACLDWYQSAHAFGAFVVEDVDAAAERFALGYTRLQLRFAALGWAKETDADLSERLALLTSETDAVLSQWKTYLDGFGQVFALLKQAEEAGLSLNAVAADSAYSASALAQIGVDETVLSSVFADWDADGWREAAVQTADTMVLYVPRDGAMVKASAVPLALVEPQLETPLPDAPLILTRTSTPVSAFAIVAVADGALRVCQRYENVADFVLAGERITFSAALEGSIKRYAEISYSLQDPDAAPALDRIDWSQEDYPMPCDPVQSVTRFMEARYYGILEEAALLASNADAAFSVVPVPASLALRCEVCYWAEDKTSALLEAYYDAEDGKVARYFTAVSDGTHWTIEAVSEQCGEISAPYDASMALLPLNAALEASLDAQETRTWRVMLPWPGQLEFSWETAAEEGTYSARLAAQESPIIEYTLHGAGVQRANALYLPAGIYSLELSAGQTSLEHFAVSIAAVRDDAIELEPNDKISEATVLHAGAEISGSLQVEGDIDLYCFALEEPGRVRVIVSGAAGEGAYQLAVASTDDNRALLTAPVGGANEAAEVYLGAGKYILQLTSGERFRAEPYRLLLEHVADAAVEWEPNDSADSATPIAENVKVQGRFDRENDVDFYAFTLDRSKAVCLQWNGVEQTGEREGARLALLSGTEELWSEAILQSASAFDSPVMVLSAGEYHVCLENTRMAAGEYSLCIATEVPTDAILEEEPNDTLGTATPVAVLTNAQGALVPAGDQDVYTFALEQSGVVTLEFAFAQPESASEDRYYVLTLAEENRHILYSEVVRGVSGSEADGMVAFSSPAAYLAKGTYYVQVSGSQHAWQGQYMLRIGYEEQEAVEGEYNDERDVAQLITPNTAVQGGFLHAADVDWFRLALEKSSMVQLRLDFAPLEESGNVYTIALMDGEEELLRANVRGKEANFASTPVCLLAGNYDIRLENPIHTQQDYCLTVACVGVEAAEAEPNDTLASATPILADKVYSGVCSDWQDIDVYCLSVAEGESPLLEFAFEPFGGMEEAFALRLEQNGRVHWETTVSEESGGISASLQLPAGEYHLSISPESGIAMPYTLSLCGM